MNRTHSFDLELHLRVVIVLLTFLFSPIAAAFGNPSAGIDFIPLGGEGADKTFMEAADRAGLPYPPIEIPIPPEDLIKLKRRVEFSLLSDEEIQTKVEHIRRAVLCSIELLQLSEPALAEGLNRNFRLGLISIGITPVFGIGADAMIRIDGKEQFHLEPVNLFRLPCKRLTGSDVELFELINILAAEAIHATQAVDELQTTSGWEMGFSRMCAEIEMLEAEIARCEKMAAVIRSVFENGVIPTDATGMFARLGAEVLREKNKPGPNEEYANRWEVLLSGIKIRAEGKLNDRMARKRAFELAISGDPRGVAMLESLMAHSPFSFQWSTEGQTSTTAWISSIGPRFNEIDGQPIEFLPSNSFRQIYPGAAGIESHTIEGLDTISAGLVIPERGVTMFGGLVYGAGPSGVDLARVYAFENDPATGRVRTETEQVAATCPDMIRGYSMFYNPDDGEVYTLERDSGNVRQISDSDDDGLPDRVTFAGEVLPAREDYGLNLSYAYFKDRDTIVANYFDFDTVFDRRNPFSISLRIPGGLFVDQPGEEFRENLLERPAIDGRIGIGTIHVPLTGTPGIGYELFDGMTSIGSGRFSSLGRDVLHLGSPVASGAQLWIQDQNLFSSIGVTPEAINDFVSSIFFPTQPSPEDGGIQIGFEFRPDLRGDLGFGSSLDDFGQTKRLGGPSRFGSVFSHLPTDMLGDPGRGYFRLSDGPNDTFSPQADMFHVTPGTFGIFDLSANDNAPANAVYHLKTDPDLLPKNFSLSADGIVSGSFPTFDSGVSFQYSVSFGDEESENIIAEVVPDIKELRDPPKKKTKKDPITGEEICVLNAHVLRINGRDYPLYQFALRDAGPPDNCLSDHWHSPGRPRVYPIGLPATGGIIDEDPNNCGYGKLEDLPNSRASVQKEVWDQFLADHP